MTVRPLLTVALVVLVAAACGDARRAPDATTRPAAVAASVVTDACDAVIDSASGDAVADSAAEVAALRTRAGWRRVDGVTLRYDAPRGTSLTLVDDSADDEGYVKHYLLGRLGATDYAVVSRTRNEALDYLLVHLPTGDTLSVRDVPLPSPDGRYVAAAKADLVAGFDDSGLDVVALTPAGPRREYSRTTSRMDSTAGWAPVHVRWDGATLSYGHAVPVDGAPGQCRVTPERLVRTSSGWETRGGTTP